MAISRGHFQNQLAKMAESGELFLGMCSVFQLSFNAC